MSTPALSVVIPFLNEEKSLPLLKERFLGLKGLPESWELLFVSDGSTDGSVSFIESWASSDERVKLLVLTRNFGQQAAISAGLDHASGTHVGVMDADLQDTPEALLEMYEEARQGGWDIVYNVRSGRSGSPLKRLAYRLFYSSYSYFAESPVDADSGDFCVLSRRAVDTLSRLPERTRFIRGLRSWLGLSSKAVSSHRPERAAGKAQYSLSKLFTLAMDGLTSFSSRPLRVVTLLGFSTCLASLCLGVAYLVLWKLQNIHDKLPGFLTIVLLFLFVSGVQIFILGIIGEYIGQIFQEVKRRPTYLLGRSVNLPGPADRGSGE